MKMSWTRQHQTLELVEAMKRGGRQKSEEKDRWRSKVSKR